MSIKNFGHLPPQIRALISARGGALSRGAGNAIQDPFAEKGASQDEVCDRILRDKPFLSTCERHVRTALNTPPLEDWLIFARPEHGGGRWQIVSNLVRRTEEADRVALPCPQLAARLREPVPTDCVRVLLALGAVTAVRDLPVREVIVEQAVSLALAEPRDASGEPLPQTPSTPVFVRLAADPSARILAAEILAHPEPESLLLRVNARREDAPLGLEVALRTDLASELSRAEDKHLAHEPLPAGAVLALVVTAIERRLTHFLPQS